MQIERYVDRLREQLGAAAAAGDDDVRLTAERLSIALDPAVRLVLLEVLSDASSEITRELAPGSVDVRLRGRDPEFVVSRPSAGAFDSAPEEARRGPAAPAAETADDASTSRTTLRLPDQLKARVERAAAEDGLSLNTWLVRAVAGALEPKTRRSTQRGSRTGDSFTGWVS